MALARKPEMDRLESKLAALKAKKASITGQTTADVTNSATSSIPVAMPAVEQIQVQVPEGVPPGGEFFVQLPSGQLANATVPPNAVAGQMITIDVPLFTQGVVQGIPLA